MGDSKRWTVTYTKHFRQKRKVYQDGFLDLYISTNKVKLYDECEKLLECRILKKDETVASGDTLEFNGYLVDIGGPEGHNNLQSDFNVVDRKHNHGSRFRTPSKDTKINAKENISRPRQPLSPSQRVIKDFKKRELLKYASPKINPEATKPSTTEQPPSKPCFGQDAGLNPLFTMEEKKSSRIVPPIKPLRDVNQILSILQGPMPQESDNTGGPSPNKSCQNIMDRESTETMKSLDITSSKAGSAAACGGGSFQFTENLNMSQQPHSDKEPQTNTRDRY